MMQLETIKQTKQSAPLLTTVGLLCLMTSTIAEAKTIIVQPNDTLSGLVYKHYPDAANPLEIMRRMHANNPNAFVANNPNRLIVGKEMVLDDEAPKTVALEAQTRIGLLETEKQSLNTQLQTLEDENAQLKVLIKRFENEQQTYDANIQQLERKIADLSQKVANTPAEPSQVAAAQELTNKLNADLAKAKNEYEVLQLQLKEARKLNDERDKTLTELKSQLQDQKTSNDELTKALQEARELNSQLTLDLQQQQQSSNLPWFLAGGAALLLIPLLWLVRRRPVELTTDTPKTAVSSSSPETDKIEPVPTPLPESLPNSRLASGLNEGNLKLNIARAYLDKRDARAASELLQEVLREGDEAQKQQAREILSFIS